MTKTKILYIAGWGRSGSTLLGNILGSLPGFVHVGEARYVWDRGLLENWDCGCGETFDQCATWGRVLDVFPSPRENLIRETLSQRENGLRTRDLLMSEQTIQTRLDTVRPLLATLATLYHSIQRVHDCRVIIDSSKFPSYAHLLDTIPDMELYVLHLVRDPRAVAFSWWKRQMPLNKASDQRAVTERHHPFKSALLWLEWNHIIHKMWGKRSGHYLLLRYEDFLTAPSRTIQNILTMLNESPADLPFLDERTVRVLPQHTISGNPVRFNVGDTVVEEKRVGSDRLAWWYQAGVSLLCWPLLGRYDYPLF